MTGALKVQTAPGVWTTIGGGSLVPFASNAETIAGTVTDKAITPAGLAAAVATPKLHLLDVWTRPIFDNGLNVFVTGQNLATIALTAAAAAGATVLTVADATGFLPGYCFITNWGTATQQVHRVVSVAANDVTVARPVVTALASGALTAAFWTNASHLTTDAGFQTLAYEIAYAKDADGSYMIQGTTPKVTYLGNSWFALGATRYADKLHLRIPGAVVVNAGVGGDTSQRLLDRFDTDVPADSDYVVFNEPSVNDTYQTVAAGVQATHLEQLYAKIKAIGAIPIYVGPVPLSDFPAVTVGQHAQMVAHIGDGSLFPAVTMTGVAAMSGNADLIFVPNSTSVALAGREGGSLDSATGVANVAVGSLSGADVTTGFNNVLIGRQAAWKLTTGNTNIAVGQGALATATSAAGNIAIGATAGFSVTSNSNVFVGDAAGYSPNFVTANASTTGAGQTVLGARAGQGTTGVLNFITCLGHKTLCSGIGSVAIGIDSGGTGAAALAINEIAIGTANHSTIIRGKVGFNGATPVAKAANPGTASGTDAAVLNAVITALRNLGLVT